LRDDFLGMERGSLDWLGYDDGGRDLPSILADPETRPNFTTSFYVPARSNDSLAAILDEGSKSVSDNMTPLQMSSPLNHGLAFSVGNQVKLAGKPLGFFVGINYKRDYTMYAEGISNQWQLIEYNGVGLNNNFNLTDQMATENPNLGGIVNLAYKLSANHEIGANLLYNHDAAITARTQSGKYPSVVSNSDAIFETRSLLFRERSLQSYQVNGKHLLPALNNTRIEWAGGKVSTSQLEPDLRFFANTVVGDSAWFINPSEYPQPYHFWRYLYDDQYNGKLDISIPFMVEKSNSNKLQLGALYSDKTRTFEEDRWQMLAKDGEAYQGDADSYFGADNTGVIGFDDITDKYIIGNYIADRSVDANNYSGTEIISAVYAMTVYQLTEKWKFVGGARMEWTNIEVASADSTKPIGEIQGSDLLPSLNLIYALNENSNIRGSFTQTIARPNLRELAPFFSFEFIGGETFLGNPELERTNISNYDLRYEVFPKPGEMIAVSAYYKDFTNPIIKVYNPTATNPEIQFKNVDKALVYGLEFEIRKTLDL
jgi:outer membrane receptor protein involved in Fe transport